MRKRLVAVHPCFLAFFVISTSMCLEGADTSAPNNTLALLVTKIRQNGDEVCVIQRQNEGHRLVNTLPKTMELSLLAPIICKDFDYTLVHWANYSILIPTEMEHESAASPITLILTDLSIDDALSVFGKQFGVGIGSIFLAPPLSKIRITAKIEETRLWPSLAILMREGDVGYWDASVSGPFPSLPGKPSVNTTRIIAVSIHSK